MNSSLNSYINEMFEMALISGMDSALGFLFKTKFYIEEINLTNLCFI